MDGHVLTRGDLRFHGLAQDEQEGREDNRAGAEQI
jgi:hypothetical protein